MPKKKKKTPKGGSLKRVLRIPFQLAGSAAKKSAKAAFKGAKKQSSRVVKKVKSKLRRKGTKVRGAKKRINF